MHPKICSLNLSIFYRMWIQHTFFFACIFFIFSWVFMYAESKYPVDISYLVSDFKYSQEHGLKICEVQQGALSALNGDLYISGEDGIISPRIADFFTLFPIKKWASGVHYSPLKRSLMARDWVIHQSIQTLCLDPLFLDCAKVPPQDPCSISSYRGFVYAALEIARHMDVYRKAYPGILFIDGATLPYWKDKFKMNALFNQNPQLKQYKADWRLYPKKYDSFLSERIQQDMPAKLYVIKPRTDCLANGVIVVANTDLDEVLQMILEPLPSLGKHVDKKYAYWWKNQDSTFLIEKYYPSDVLCFPDPVNPKAHCQETYHYDATMRIAFVLEYNEGAMTYHCLGGFWKLPSKALEEEGTLNEQRISCCEVPFYTSVDPELFVEINAQMEQAMLLLYQVMLQQKTD